MIYRHSPIKGSREEIERASPIIEQAKNRTIIQLGPIAEISPGEVAAALATDAAARRWQLAALAALSAPAAAAAYSGWLSAGQVWGFPLADLVWWFDTLMLLETVVALLLATLLGTPGCEIGVWPELIARARRGRATPAKGLDCLVGLHLVDAWEARRRARKERDAHA